MRNYFDWLESTKIKAVAATREDIRNYEDGVDIRYIQELLGHGSIETTERYTHVTQRGMERIKSPLDSFKL